MVMGMTRVLILVLLAAWIAAPSAFPVAAEPLQQAELLANGNFESTSGATGSGQAAWVPWWSEIPKPADGSLNYANKPGWNAQTIGTGAAPELIYGGQGSQAVINNWDPWWAGVKQTINAPAGSRVRFTAIGRAWAASDHWPTASESVVQSRMRVGIEPNGTGDQFSNSVIWSGYMNPHGVWQSLSVEATVGASGKVTVILSADYRGDSRLWMASFWDDASLVVVNAVPATSAPQPTSAAPANTQPAAQPTAPVASGRTATPNADGQIIYVVQSGDTLWGIAAVHGASLDELRALNGLTSDFISVGQSLIISQGQGSAPTATTESGATAEGTADPAEPTAAATEPAPENTTIAQVSPTPLGTGIVCALIWDDANGNGVRDAAETLVLGGLLTVVDITTGQQVDAHTTDNTAQPHCFEDIPEGQYTVSSAPPPGYNPTTPGATTLGVEAGFTSILEFGIQPSASQVAPTPAGSNRVLRTALLGAGGVMFLLLAAGVAGFLFMRRPR